MDSWTHGLMDSWTHGLMDNFGKSGNRETGKRETGKLGNRETGNGETVHPFHFHAHNALCAYMILQGPQCGGGLYPSDECCSEDA